MTTTGDRAIQALALHPSTLPMRVLAAEDNPVFQSMLKSMLTRWGYQAVIARSGTEAWRILEAENAPRLAILDWMMPGMDGVESAGGFAAPTASHISTSSCLPRAPNRKI